MKFNRFECWAALLLLAGCASDRTGREDLDRYLEFCRETAMEPVCAEDSEDPCSKVDWMVGASVTTQEFKKDFKIVYADARYLSYHTTEYSYFGGAHGSTAIRVGTLHRGTGKRAVLSDFIPSSKQAALKTALHRGAVKALGGAEHLQTEVTIIDNFYLAKDGLHFIYNEYEIACYAAGPVEVVIPRGAFGCPF